MNVTNQTGKRILFTLVALLFSLVAVAQQATFPRETGDEDPTFPENIQKNTEALLEKWRRGYASHRALPKQPCDKETPAPAGNEVIRERLFRLPTSMPIVYNEHVRNYIQQMFGKRRALVPAMLPLGDYYFPIIEPILEKYGLPLELKYLTIIESGLDPSAGTHSSSRGLWQLMLPVAKSYGLEVNSLVDERMDPIKCTEAAARVLVDLYGIYNDWFLTIAAYNCGPGTLNRIIKRSGGKRDYWQLYEYLPKQTRKYVPLFIAVYYAMYYHAEHNLCPREITLPMDIDTILVSRRVSIAEIARAAELDESAFRLLNPAFKGKDIPGHVHPYVINLPSASLLALTDKLDLGEETQLEALPPATQAELPQAPTAEAAPRRRTGQKQYTIRRGDTYWSIARMHGVQMKDLMKANGIHNPKTTLRVGQKLIIPDKQRG